MSTNLYPPRSTIIEAAFRSISDGLAGTYYYITPSGNCLRGDGDPFLFDVYHNYTCWIAGIDLHCDGRLTARGPAMRAPYKWPDLVTSLSDQQVSHHIIEYLGQCQSVMLQVV